MSNDSSWFSTGLNSYLESVPSSPQSKSDFDPFRFSIGTGETKRIIFLDDTAFHTREHALMVDGRLHYYTCLSVMGETCPLCEAAKQQGDGEISIAARGGVAYTVIDLTPTTSKAGKTFPVTKKLLVASTYAAKMLLMVRQNRVTFDEENGIAPDKSAGFKDHKFVVSRSSDKASRVGDHYEHYQKVTDYKKELKDAYNEDLTVPFDYVKVFTPKTSEELTAIANKWLTTRSAPQTSAKPNATIRF